MGDDLSYVALMETRILNTTTFEASPAFLYYSQLSLRESSELATFAERKATIRQSLIRRPRSRRRSSRNRGTYGYFPAETLTFTSRGSTLPTIFTTLCTVPLASNTTLSML